MRKRQFTGWRTLGACLTLACLSATASGQPIPGMAADGSITADGVTFTADELRAFVETYLGNPALLPADLPGSVRAAVYALAAGRAPTPAPLPIPTPGGAP